MLQKSPPERPSLARRTTRYGLYGTALAALAGSAVLWAGVEKTVTLDVDGSSRTVHTVATTVDGALRSAGYSAGDHDLVAPARAAGVKDGQTIVLRRGRLLHLSVDGQTRDVWTTATTVDEALNQLGYTGLDATSVSRSTRLPLSGTGLAIRAPKAVTLTHDGRTETVTTTAATVADVLAGLHVALGADDRISAPLASAPTGGEHLVIERIAHQKQIVTEAVPFPTQQRTDPNLVAGQTQVVQPGKAGAATVTYDAVYIDGALAGRTQTGRVTTAAAVAQVTVTGTGPSPDDVANNQAIARSMLGQYGFDDSQMSCLITLWNHESGWQATAQNANGGAYGIPQALPAEKLASAGAGWRLDPRVQIAWGLAYIRDSYGTPCSAWDLWQAHGGWY